MAIQTVQEPIDAKEDSQAAYAPEETRLEIIARSQNLEDSRARRTRADAIPELTLEAAEKAGREH